MTPSGDDTPVAPPGTIATTPGTYLDPLLAASSDRTSRWNRWTDWLIGRRARRNRRLELMSSEELATESRLHDLRLRKRVGNFALGAVTAELIVANTVFVVYAGVGEHWKLPTAAINVWLGATVVQVIGILYVIAHYLFPRSGTPLSR